jgi:hypothetical protein
MASSGPPVRLLSPPLEIISQHSRKSNSSIDSRNSYLSSVGSHVVASQKDTPSERPLTLSRISVGLGSPPCASDYGSNHSNESNYLSAPQSQGDDDKPPYKARSPRSASLNMATGRVDHMINRGHKDRAEKRPSKHKRRPLLENKDENEQAYRENRCNSELCLPGCKKTSRPDTESDEDCERLEMFVKSIGGLKNTIKGPDEDLEDCSSQFMSKAAANITSRRWSSIGIGANELPRRSSVVADPTGDDFANQSLKRSKCYPHGPSSDEIMRVVRARLTFREFPAIHLPTPASITLRRASGITTGIGGGLSTISKVDISRSHLGQSEQLKEAHPSASTYLITTDDIDFITSLIQSGFDIRRTTLPVPNRNAADPRKPSVTSQGLLPQSSVPADLTTTIADVHQSSSLPCISFNDSERRDSKLTKGGVRKLSRANPLKNVPEVIWEDTGSPGSPSFSSKASSSSEGRYEVMDDSSDVWLLGQPAGSLHAVLPGNHRHKSSDNGDNSPTSRVFQGVFKELTKEMPRAPRPFPEQTAPDKNIESQAMPGKRNSFPSISFRPDVVSFPPLPSRKFTSDWISPLPDMSKPASGGGKCLYGAGIDAHVCASLKDPNTSALDVGQGGAVTEANEQQRRSPSPDSESHVRGKSANLLHPQVSARLGDRFKVGNAIGCSSGVRRKSSTRSVPLKINDEAPKHHLHEDQTSWVKPWKDSGWPAPKSSSPEELNSRKSSQTLPPLFMQARG